jgi:hypothetical protein
MKLTLAILATLTALFFAACSSSDEPDPTPTLGASVDLHVERGKPFDLRISNSALLLADGDPYRLDFTNVIADSRCPADGECLRPDVAIFEFTLTDLDSDDGSTIHQMFFDAGPSEAVVGPFTVQLLAVTPTVEDASSPSDYVLTLLAGVTPEPSSLIVNMTSTATSATTGDRVTYTLNVEGVSRPQYTLTTGGALLGIVRHDGTLTRGSQTPVFDLLDWSADETHASWTVEVLSPGEFQIQAAVLASLQDVQTFSPVTGQAISQLVVE